ncbi:phosphate acetyltransferase [Hyaloraphidium curvatum]|nr:phosphate acetyltransferase [Hyaloraphidium curvatum]
MRSSWGLLAPRCRPAALFATTRPRTTATSAPRRAAPPGTSAGSSVLLGELLQRTRAFATAASAASAASLGKTAPASSASGLSVYLHIVGSDPKHNNKPALLLGLANYLQRYATAGYFGPIAAAPYRFPGAPKVDRNVLLLQEALGMPATNGVDRELGFRLLSSSPNYEDLLEAILGSYLKFRPEVTHCVIGGVDRLGGHFSFLDAKIAVQLDAAVLACVEAPKGKDTSVVANDVNAVLQSLKEEKARVLGIMLNMVHLDESGQAMVRDVKARVEAAGERFLGYFPEDPRIMAMKLNEIVALLGGDVIAGTEDGAPLKRIGQKATDAAGVESEMALDMGSAMLSEQVTTTLVLTGPTTPAVQKLKRIASFEPPLKAEIPPRILAVTDAHNSDLLLGLTTAAVARQAPNLAGIVAASGLGPGDLERPDRGIRMDETAERILRGVPAQLALPCIATSHSLQEVLEILAHAEEAIPPSSPLKISRAIHLFDAHADLGAFASLMNQADPGPRDYINPKLFMHRIIERCRAEPQRIVLPEGTERRVLKAAGELTERKLARITLLGSPGEIASAAERLGIRLDGMEIVDPHDIQSPRFRRYLDDFVRAREAKGKAITAEQATDQLQDVNYFGCMMVRCGDADGMVSGAVHTTAATVRPALQLLGRPDKATGSNKLTSSVFFMLLPDRVLIYGDCAVVVSPDSAELAQIAVSSAETARAFGLDPRVALTSFATLGSNSGPLVQKVADAVEALRGRGELPFDVDGPFQYDAAVDPEVAKVKVNRPSKVAGRANVLIFPDLNTGNVTYKAVQQSTGAVAMGPILQGLAKPVNDLSRGAKVLDIINTILITSIQSMQSKEGADS